MVMRGWRMEVARKKNGLVEVVVGKRINWKREVNVLFGRRRAC